MGRVAGTYGVRGPARNVARAADALIDSQLAAKAPAGFPTA